MGRFCMKKPKAGGGAGQCPVAQGHGTLLPFGPRPGSAGCRAGAEGCIYYKTFCLGFKLEKHSAPIFHAELRSGRCHAGATLCPRSAPASQTPRTAQCQPGLTTGATACFHYKPVWQRDGAAGAEAGGRPLAVPLLPLPHARGAEMRQCAVRLRFTRCPLARSTRTPFSHPSPRVWDAIGLWGRPGTMPAQGCDLRPGAFRGLEITWDPGAGQSVTAQRSGDALSPGQAGGSSIPSLLPNCASGRDDIQRAQACRAPHGLPGKHGSRALLGNSAPLRAANGPGAGQSHSSPCTQCPQEQPWVCSHLCLLGNGESKVLGNRAASEPLD